MLVQSNRAVSFPSLGLNIDHRRPAVALGLSRSGGHRSRSQSHVNRNIFENGIARRSRHVACQAHPAAAIINDSRRFVSSFGSNNVNTFIMGGLFFLTARSLLVRLIDRRVRKKRNRTRTGTLILRQLLTIVSLSLRTARAALFVDSSWWNWGDAWSILRKSWDDTKRAAAEGVEALRLQERLKSTSVGPGGVTILQYLMDHWTPNYLSRTLQTSLRDTLQNIDDRNIQRIILNRFDVGKSSPHVTDVRTFELDNNCMAFDVDVTWESEIQAKMMITISNRLASVMGRRAVSLPLTVQNVRFQGTIRVILTPLTPEPPGFGAMLVSLPTAPSLGLDVRMAGGEITKFPWLRSEITSALQRCITDEFLWPRRMVLPSEKIITRMDGTTVTRALLSMRTLEELKYTDPLVQMERELEYSKQLLRSKPSKDRAPGTPKQSLETNLDDLVQMDIRVNKEDDSDSNTDTRDTSPQKQTGENRESDVFVLGDWNIGNYTDFATSTMTNEFNNMWRNALTAVWQGSNTTTAMEQQLQQQQQISIDVDNNWIGDLRP
mmetsp:Transcript_69792/g.103823  ORF Transcript_69792/g.103823 Transcript_69792/m.103823 type:complete len:549 (+) Transcript_69792:182-1828(+)